MYFIFEIEFNSNKSYIKNLIVAYVKKSGVSAQVMQSNSAIYLVLEKEQEKLEEFLLGLEQILPASLYMKGSKHYFSDTLPDIQEIEAIYTPLNIALCPNCQKEMFDISSNRYYYPFTSCNSCGTQHPFLDKYPFIRENTLLNFFKPCKSCQEELKSNPFRENYPLISCIECGVALRMLDKKSERFANSKGEFRKLFEVSAKALSKGKTILFKTLNGYRLLYKANSDLINPNTKLLMCNANAINTHLMLIPQEFNAILSIERPLLRVATKSQEIKEFFPFNTFVKYADDAMSILLAKELVNLGIDYICYEDATSSTEADFLVDYNLPTTKQEDCQLFINQDLHFFVSGERSIFPLVVENPDKRVVVANKKIVNRVDSVNLVDNIELFDLQEPKVLYLQKGDKNPFNTNRVYEFSDVKATILSVIAQNSLLNEKVVAIHFDNRLHFSYYNGKSVADLITPSSFNSQNILGKIRLLREGSDRLVENFKIMFPKLYNRLMKLDKDIDFFSVVAIILELKDESFNGISSESLHFMGKGGIQIDCKLNESKFDYYAFLASILSYKIAGVEANLICYSIYESFGDYIAEIVQQIFTKVKTNHIALSGIAFANQPLLARIDKNLGRYNILLPKELPINIDGSILGGLFV